MRKKILISLAAFVLIILTTLFIYRYQILQYTAETLIRRNLPDYVKIGSIKFNFGRSIAVLDGVKVVNPPGFSKDYIVEIDRITCRYKLTGKTMFDGLELFDLEIIKGALNIERLENGLINFSELQRVLGRKGLKDKADEGGPGGGGEAIPSQKTPKKDASRGLIKLPEKFQIKDSSLIFVDRLVMATPQVITFDNIKSESILKMDNAYTSILSINSIGEGNVNGDSGQVVKWTISMDPGAPNLTMSSRFEVSGVDIVTFQPYYDKYSPIVFNAGIFSGLLIFDFEDGNIGSTNEVRLSGIKFYVKQGQENAQFWETTVPDIVKYFTSPYGEIIFDFKIKGEMSSPRFYLGPKSRAAVTSMAIDKISEAIANASGPKNAGGAKSDIDKAKEYIDMFRGLIKRQ